MTCARAQLGARGADGYRPSPTLPSLGVIVDVVAGAQHNVALTAVRGSQLLRAQLRRRRRRRRVVC